MRVLPGLVIALLAACNGDRTADQDEAEMRVLAAQREADEAKKAAREAEEKLAEVSRQLQDFEKRVNAAIDQLAAAQNDADRAAAKARLKELQKEKQEMEDRIRMTHPAKVNRGKPDGVSPSCLDNPLAKGC